MSMSLNSLIIKHHLLVEVAQPTLLLFDCIQHSTFHSHHQYTHEPSHMHQSQSLTSCQGEGPMEVKGHQGLLQFSQEVLEHTADHMDVIHLGQVGLPLALQQLLLQLFDLGVAPA